MSSPMNDSGFTAVELLITLLIAAMFLFAGYQLYTQVTRDGNDANLVAKASNVSYEIMRDRAISVSASQPNGCTLSSASTNVQVRDRISYDSSVSCVRPASSSLDVFYVTVRAYKPNPTGGAGYGPLITEVGTYVN